MTEFATLTCHCILNGWAISKCLDKVSRHNTLYLQCLEHGQSICKWMFLVDALMLWANGEFWGGNSPAQRGYSPHIYQSLGWFVPFLGVSRVGGHGIGPRRLNPAQIPIIRLVPMFFCVAWTFVASLHTLQHFNRFLETNSWSLKMGCLPSFMRRSVHSNYRSSNSNPGFR